MGEHYGHLTLGRAVHDCPASPSRPIDPPDRGSSGSLAIERLSRAEAQQRRARSATSRAMPRSRPLPGAGRARAWNAMPSCAPSSSTASARGWSPEQIAGRLKQQKAATTISHESIYRFIYAQIRRTNDGAWRNYLPRAKYKRGWHGRRKRSADDLIKGRVSIALRPRRRRAAGAPSATGKPTSCCSPPPARPPSWRTNASPASSWEQGNPARPRSPLPSSSGPGSSRSIGGCGDPSPSTTAPSSPSTSSSPTSSPSGPSSATRTVLGRRAPSRTPSADCAGLAQKDQPRHHRPRDLRGLHRRLQQHAAKVPRASGPPLKSFSPNCCTSNVNPHPRCARDDISCLPRR